MSSSAAGGRSQLSDNAMKIMTQANASLAEKDFPKALQSYEGAVQLLRAAIMYDTGLNAEKKAHLKAYMDRCEGVVKQLRDRGVIPPPREPPANPNAQRYRDPNQKNGGHGSVAGAIPSMAGLDKAEDDEGVANDDKGTSAPPTGTVSPPPPSGGSTPPPAAPPSIPKEDSNKAVSNGKNNAEDEEDMLAGMDFSVPSGSLGSPASPAGKKSVPAPAPSNSDTPAPPPPAKPAATPGKVVPKTRPGASTTAFAPAVSNLVNHALDLSEKLIKEGKIKEAIDAVDHAYETGKKEEYNPGNFNKIQDHLVDMRKFYLSKNPPRLLQENKVTQQEIEILRKSSQTQLMLLPMWDDVNEGYPRENVYLPVKDGMWEDTFTPRLSPQQTERGAKYVRPHLLVDDPATLAVVKECNPMHVKQTVVGDCSLVCSLIICASLQQRFPQAKVLSCIYPQDAQGNPVINRRGKYCVKMLLNGTTRIVSVDDRLPAAVEIDSDGKPKVKSLLCSYSKDPSELWISIIEKAFIKVCGGSYNFPGSNSSNDLYMLSGWLPDFLAFDAEDFNKDLQWVRLSTCLRKGMVLATVNTPAQMVDGAADKLGLISGHAYALLDMRETKIGNHKLCKIKNPWAKQSWQGLFSLRDEQRLTPALQEELGFSEEEAEQGVFWMSWQDVVKFFSRCHMSWNPFMLFAGPSSALVKPTRIACHGTYIHNDAFAVLPQFHIAVQGVGGMAKTKTRMHLVLSRHITDVREYCERDDAGNTLPLLTCHVYDVSGLPPHLPAGRGRRIASSVMIEFPESTGITEPVHRGVYKNVPHQTISFDCPLGASSPTRDLVVVVSQHKAAYGTGFNFTLTLHTELKFDKDNEAKSQVTMKALPMFQMPHSTRIQTAWKSGVSCGGKVGEPTFGYNPQFKLTLTNPSRVLARLVPKQKTEPVQLYLVKRGEDTSQKGQAAGYEMKPVPWAGRIDRLLRDPRDKTQSFCLECPAYCSDVAVVDSTLEDCICFDKTGTLKRAGATPAAPAPPAPGAPSQPPPKPAVPEKDHYDIHIKCPVSANGGRVKQTDIPNIKLPRQSGQNKAATVYSLLPFLLAHKELAAAGVTNVIFHGKNVGKYPAIEREPIDAIINDAPKDAKADEAAPTSNHHTFIVILNTEDLPRTQELNELQTKVFGIAEQVVNYYDNELKDFGNNRVPRTEEEEKKFAMFNERITQLLIETDEVIARTDDIRQTRKALVVALQSIGAFVSLIAHPGGITKSPTTGGAAAAAPVLPSAHLLPVKSVTPNSLLPPGEYTLVASCYEKGKPAAFDLLVETDCEHQLAELPQEGHDCVSHTIQGQWAGDPQPFTEPTFSSPFFSRNPMAVVQVDKKSWFTARLLVIDTPAEVAAAGGNNKLPPVTPLMGIFRAASSATAEIVGDKLSHHSVGPIILNPGKYYIPLSTAPDIANRAGNKKFALRLFCTSQFTAKLNAQ